MLLFIKKTDIANAIDELKNSDDEVKKYFEKIGWDKCKTEYITELDISILNQIKTHLVNIMIC